MTAKTSNYHPPSDELSALINVLELISAEISRRWAVAYQMGESAFSYRMDDTPPLGLSQAERDLFRSGYKDAWSRETKIKRHEAVPKSNVISLCAYRRRRLNFAFSSSFSQEEI